MKFRIPRLLFMVFAALLLVAVLAVNYIGELLRTQGDLMSLVQYLSTVQAEREELAEQMEEQAIQVEQLQQRNTELEEMLLNRAKTYTIVTQNVQLAMAPEREQLLSRSGRELTGTTMPVLSSSGFTAASLESAFDSLGATGMAGTGEGFIQAERNWGVNALVLAAIAVLESGWGRSAIARDKNNLLGLGAFDHDPYNCAFTFENKADSIHYAAELLSVHYLTPGGRWHRGDDLTAIGKSYATDPAWARKVAAVAAMIARAAVEDPELLLAMAEEVQV